jgi:hypothetical protein
MGRRNTSAESTCASLKGYRRSRASNRTEHCPGWVLIEYSPTGRFSRGITVGPTEYIVFHRPVELARITGYLK